MTATEYFDLVDKSGRMTRPDKRGSMEAGLAPMLQRIGANPNAWFEIISRFGSKFGLVAGSISNLSHFANRLDRRWFQGVAVARTAFISSPPQMA
jgi:hypothetical protein